MIPVPRTSKSRLGVPRRTLAIGLLAATTLAACNQTKPNQNEMMNSNPASTDPVSAQPARASARTITFHQDRIYEITGIWIKAGKQGQLDAYFSKVFPIAAHDYGVNPLFSLEAKSAYSGDFVPDILFVNEWPKLASFEGFVADARVTALFPERDDAVSRLVVTHYEVPDTVRTELSDGDVVEFGAMWLKPGKEAEISRYYRDVMPIAERHGLRRITPLSPVLSYRGDFRPDRAGLHLWKRQENFERFAEEARPLFPRRDAALASLSVTHALVRFPDNAR